MQVYQGNTLVTAPQAAASFEARGINRTYLLLANAAAECEYRCELHLVQREEDNVERVLAAAPLLEVNTMMLQLAVPAPCTLYLRATCPASSGCHAPEPVRLDSPVEQQALLLDSQADLPDAAHAELLLQRIEVKVMHEGGTAQETDSVAESALGQQVVRRAVTWSLVITIIGLQGCLLCRVSGMRMLH